MGMTMDEIEEQLCELLRDELPLGELLKTHQKCQNIYIGSDLGRPLAACITSVRSPENDGIIPKIHRVAFYPSDEPAIVYQGQSLIRILDRAWGHNNYE